MINHLVRIWLVISGMCVGFVLYADINTDRNVWEMVLITLAITTVYTLVSLGFT